MTTFQEPPQWMWELLEQNRPRSNQAKKPTPKDMPRKAPRPAAPKPQPRMAATCLRCGLRTAQVGQLYCPTCKGIVAKEEKAKAEAKATPRKLRVRVVVHGYMDFVVDGELADQLRPQLDGSVDDVMEALDPWVSGISIAHEVTVIEDPADSGGNYYQWQVSESEGTVVSAAMGGSFGPFYYTIQGGGTPTHLEWSQVPMPGQGWMIKNVMGGER